MVLPEWQWLYGKPDVQGRLKASPEDFKVIEDLGYQADGEGEHLLVRIRKTGCTTRFVAEALAKFAKIHPRDVSFAGMKDRYAITEQTLCLRLPGKEAPDFSTFLLEGCEILHLARHKRKLRIGALAGNAFKLVLRDISDRTLLEARLQRVQSGGVPNYFGQQRFGFQGNNLEQVKRWANNQIRVRERNKRSFLLSAARSVLFNQVVSDRLAQLGSLTQAMPGDALQLTGRGSWFVATQEALPLLQQRIENNELRITAPLPGCGEWGSRDDALSFEQLSLTDEMALIALLERERVEAARRAMLVIPRDMRWTWCYNATLALSFWLPAGSFATSIVRELIEQEVNDADIAE